MSQSHNPENTMSLGDSGPDVDIWRLRYFDEPHRDGSIEGARIAFDSVLKRADLGFLKLGTRAGFHNVIEQRTREISRTSNKLVVLGMGGSSLGAKALLSAVARADGCGQVHFLDNIDSNYFFKWIKAQSKLEEMHWAIISKSGRTIETLALADFVDQHLRHSGNRRLSAVSTIVSEIKDSPLTEWAKRESVPILDMPADVGGRFSVLTAVGLLPAVFSGLKIDRILQGATWALQQREIVAKMTALSLGSFEQDKWVTMLWSYADGLRDFGLWWQQLWAESLAKKTGWQGQVAPRVSTPVPAIGACDQHSLLQQVTEGAKDKFVWVQRVLESEASGPILEKTLFDGYDHLKGRTLGTLFAAEAEATEQAMRESGVSVARLTTSTLDEASLGALFMLWQLVIASMGEILQINAFDQPGVERGKALTRSILS